MRDRLCRSGGAHIRVHSTSPEYLEQDARGLLCYNGTVTSLRFAADPLVRADPCFRDIATARLRCDMTIYCKDSAMCFVRSWSARGRHAWLVQRGCYHPSRDDPLPRSVLSPARSMACRHERLRDAEYKVCLCQADWCNAAVPNLRHSTTQSVGTFIICLLAFISRTNLCMP